MAGRIRTIKPELLEDAVTAGLSDMASRIFIASILLADDYGRLRAEPGWLMGQVYWAKPTSLSVEKFLCAMKELVPLVLFYEINGQRYAQIRNWNKHQRVDKPGKPRVPAPPEDVGQIRESFANVSRDPRESLATDLRPPTSDQDPDVELPAVPAPEVSKVRRTKPSNPLTACPPSTATPEELGAWCTRWDIPAADAALPRFLYWHRDKNRRRRDWRDTWREWKRREPEFARFQRPGAVVQSADNRAWKLPEGFE